MLALDVAFPWLLCLNSFFGKQHKVNSLWLHSVFPASLLYPPLGAIGLTVTWVTFWTSSWSTPSVAKWLKHILLWDKSEKPSTGSYLNIYFPDAGGVWRKGTFGLWSLGTWLAEIFHESELWTAETSSGLTCMLFLTVKRQLPSDTSTVERAVLSLTYSPWWTEISPTRQPKAFPPLSYFLWESIPIRDDSYWCSRSL